MWIGSLGADRDRASQPSGALSWPGSGQLLSLSPGPRARLAGARAEPAWARAGGPQGQRHHGRGPGNAVSSEQGSPEAPGLNFQKGSAFVEHLLCAELCPGHCRHLTSPGPWVTSVRIRGALDSAGPSGWGGVGWVGDGAQPASGSTRRAVGCGRRFPRRPPLRAGARPISLPGAEDGRGVPRGRAAASYPGREDAFLLPRLPSSSSSSLLFLPAGIPGTRWGGANRRLPAQVAEAAAAP